MDQVRQIVMIGILVATAPTAAQATKPEAIRVLVGTITPWPQIQGQVETWFRDHAKVMMHQLGDEAKFRRWGRAIPRGQYVFERVQVVPLEPQIKATVAPEDVVNPPNIVYPRRVVRDPQAVPPVWMVYRVNIPRIETGQAWVLRGGQVVIGYRRPLPPIHEADVQETVRDGQKTSHRAVKVMTGRSEQIPAGEIPQPGDEPIVADNLILYIAENGRVYF